MLISSKFDTLCMTISLALEQLNIKLEDTSNTSNWQFRYKDVGCQVVVEDFEQKDEPVLFLYFSVIDIAGENQLDLYRYFMQLNMHTSNARYALSNRGVVVKVAEYWQTEDFDIEKIKVLITTTIGGVLTVRERINNE